MKLKMGRDEKTREGTIQRRSSETYTPRYRISRDVGITDV